jgi:putative ABC transport system permease protein
MTPPHTPDDKSNDRDHSFDQELQFHLETEAEELQQQHPGLTTKEAHQAARRSLGNLTLLKEDTRVNWTRPFFDQLTQDTRYACRQLLKSKATSAAAILSLALTMGACMGAFRLIDALLFRPLPIRDPGNLYVATHFGPSPGGDRKYRETESASYPEFREFRNAAAQYADFFAIGYASRVDLTYASDADMEKAHMQSVSGSMFTSFGLGPAVGRVLTDADDQTPGGHPYAVLSHDYWARRFGSDPRVVGRTFRQGKDVYEIVGVLQGDFTGTEPGTMVDIFIPMAQRGASTLNSQSSFWLRVFLRTKPGASLQTVQDILNSVFVHYEQQRALSFIGFPKEQLAKHPTDRIRLDPASAGVSMMQREYRLGLIALGILVALVLLIACANVGNLMLARAMARGREMALRISIGASRARLIRLVLVESACVALAASALGTLFAWWSPHLVVRLINPPNNPARLQLTMDWRMLLFGMLLAAIVTALFGLLPAIRASNLHPSIALKGGEDPHSRRRLMNGLIAAQVAFCAVVLFIGGLFAATYNRLAHQSTGFQYDRVLALETVTASPQSPVQWDQLSQHMRAIPGVESTEISEWPLMSGEMRNRFIAFNGGPPVRTLTYFLNVSPGWRDAMKIPLLRGRDLTPSDVFPKTVLVNDTFVKTYYPGIEPIGRIFEISNDNGQRFPVTIAGVTGDAHYQNMREVIPPIAYAPFTSVNARDEVQPSRRATLNVRLAPGIEANALIPILRKQVTQFRADFRVSNIRTQQEIVEMHTLRERLLAMLAAFFSVVALSLAAIGLYGVLDYSVLQRRREIGIRLALGARPAIIARSVTAASLTMALLGTLAGLAAGFTAKRYLESLLYGIDSRDWLIITGPAIVLFSAVLLASVFPAIRAVRLDPIETLRND